MRIDLSHNIKDVIRGVDRLSSQLPFAVAKALTDTVKAIEKAMPPELAEDLDRPTNFTRKAFFIQAARKSRLVAVVGVKDKQAEYLKYQIEGGDRFPRRRTLKLPGAIKLDASGNIRKRDLERLIQKAKSEREIGRKWGKTKTSDMGQSHGLLYGKPAHHPNMPSGIYQRMSSGSWQNHGTQRRWLLPLVLFPARSAHYTKRFDFFAKAERIANREFVPALDRAWRQALATAR